MISLYDQEKGKDVCRHPSIQDCTAGFSQCSTAAKEMKGTQTQKKYRSDQSVFICIEHKHL